MKHIAHEIKEVLGMELEIWKYKSCVCHIAEFPNTATIYMIESKEEGKGHATTLLQEAQRYYKEKGKELRGSVALNDKMKRLYKKLKIREYDK